MSSEGTHNGLGFALNNRQQNTCRPIRDTPALFPLLQGAGVEAEAVCELLAAQLHAFAQRYDLLRSRVVDKAARKRVFAAYVGKDLAQRRFHFTSHLSSPNCHRIFSAALIAATTSESALLSAELSSPRSGFT